MILVISKYCKIEINSTWSILVIIDKWVTILILMSCIVNGAGDFTVFKITTIARFLQTFFDWLYLSTVHKRFFIDGHNLQMGWNHQPTWLLSKITWPHNLFSFQLEHHSILFLIAFALNHEIEKIYLQNWHCYIA